METPQGHPTEGPSWILPARQLLRSGCDAAACKNTQPADLHLGAYAQCLPWAAGTHADLIESDELYRDLVTALRINDGKLARQPAPQVIQVNAQILAEAATSPRQDRADGGIETRCACRFVT